jgi:hypothetical protein
MTWREAFREHRFAQSLRPSCGLPACR